MSKTQKTVLYGMLISLVCIGTMAIKIHIPVTNGFINIGDSFIIVSSLLFGPVAGMIAGGIGSALADLLSGYAHYALFTLIVKGLEGYIIGWVFLKLGKTKLAGIYGSLLGVIFMVGGYFLVASFMYSSFAVAAQGLIFDATQALASFLIGYPLYAYLSKGVKFRFNV
ncbi:putative membrane protein [Acetoanaerobium pronyense]|uniref:Membrane protein n=1 Tax=Acetoanaerobium pronyense TaxID=1482736 RepID=A0ABS4KKE8_9FIRM|nr:ECF transporter S component [Acetoanaerobium pronyense]MBP2028259.1 putative membrane protein [Acetoanaerobium pronyense]